MFWNSKKQARSYLLSGQAVWNVAGAQFLLEFTEPLCIHFFTCFTSNALGISFPDAIGTGRSEYLAGEFQPPLKEGFNLVPGFTNIYNNRPFPDVNQYRFFPNSQPMYFNPPLISRNILFASFGGTGSVTWWLNYSFPL